MQNKPLMSTSPHSKTKPNVCLVYDRVTTKYGGAECLLQHLLDLFPAAPLYTAVYNPNRTPWVIPSRVRSSFASRWWFVRRWYQFFSPIFPLVFEQFDLSTFDIIISISSAEAKGVLTSPKQLHISYLFSPPKYLAKNNAAYLYSYKLLTIPAIRSLAELPLRYLRWWDQAAAARPDYTIPISNTIAKQISGSYTNIMLEPIYPPIAVPPLSKIKQAMRLTTAQYFLSLSRLVWYKRVDLAVSVAQKTGDLLLIAGEGVMKKQLLKQADRRGAIRQKNELISDCIRRAIKHNRNIIFLNTVSEKEKTALLTHAQATLQLGKEDFGIVAIESLGHETPVILFADSGAAEVLRNKQVGILLASQNTKALERAFYEIKKMTFSPSYLRKLALSFSPEIYKRRMQKIVYDVWAIHKNGHKNDK